MDTNTVKFSLRRYKLYVIFGPIFKSIEVIFELFTPFVIRYIIDQGIEAGLENNYLRIIIPGIILVLMCLLSFGFTFICQYLSSVCSQGFGTDLRNRIYKKIATLSSLDLEKIGKGNLLTLISNDTNRLQLGIANIIRLVVRAPLLVVGSLIMSIFISIEAFLILFIAVIIIAIPIILIFYFSSRQILKVQDSIDKVSSLSNDDLAGTRVIRAFNKEEYEINKFKKLSNQYYKDAKVNQTLNALVNPITYLVLNTAAIFVVYLGRDNIFANVPLSTGSLTALIQYLNQITTALIVTFNVVIVLTKAQSSRERVNAFFKIVPSIQDGTIVDTNIDYNKDEIVKFNNVCFKYSDSEKNVVNNLNFAIRKGEKVGIIGGTGAGKTTIIKLLERFFDVTSGEILFKGQNIKDFNIKSLRKQISLVSQKTSIFNGTIKENVLMGKNDISDEEVVEALKEADAYSFVSKYEDTINHEIVESGKNLSGGQKQRITIARALIKKSDILILDDSASALDFLTDKKIRETIASKKDLTTIIISQRATSLKGCDKILVMDKGYIDSIGTHEELLKNSSIYKEIYESQVNLND